MTFQYPLFSWEGQKERWENVFLTYKEIFNNLLSGNIFKGVPVSSEYQGTLLGKAASVLSSPFGIASGGLAIASTPYWSPYITTSTALKVGGITAGVYAGNEILKTTTSTIKEGGITGLIVGTKPPTNLWESISKSLPIIALIVAGAYLINKQR